MWQSCISNNIRAPSQEKDLPLQELRRNKKQQQAQTLPFLPIPAQKLPSSMASGPSISAVTCQCSAETGKLAYSCIPRLAEGFEQLVKNPIEKQINLKPCTEDSI